MPLLYDDIEVVPSGILTVQSFAPPRNGRKVKFSLPNGYDRKSVYTCIDGKYSGPYYRAERVKSEIKSLELLQIDSHSANVIVIDTSETILKPISLTIPPVTVTLSSGQKAAFYVKGTLNVSISVSNSEALLEDYRDNGIFSAEFRAESVIRDCFQKRILQRIQELNGLSTLDALAGDVSEDARRDAEAYPDCPKWFKILNCSLELESPNFDEIIEKENYNWRKEEEEERIKHQNDEKIRIKAEETRIALAAEMVYQREAIPEGMTKLLEVYVQSNPQVPIMELISICEKFRDLSHTYSLEAILQTAGALGLFPDNLKK